MFWTSSSFDISCFNLPKLIIRPESLILFSILNFLGLKTENDGDLGKEMFGFELSRLFLDKAAKDSNKDCSALLGTVVLDELPPPPQHLYCFVIF